jgi:hypothetical protein
VAIGGWDNNKYTDDHTDVTRFRVRVRVG